MTRRDKKNAPDAITLLTEDHREVKAMFEDFEDLKDGGSAEDKTELVQRICSTLAIHMTIEEEIFYPAVREVVDDEELMSEAEVEHASAKDLIAQLEGEEAGSDHYDARVTVLSELIDHHVKEEESKMFPRARKELDLAEVGAELVARKAELIEVADEDVGDDDDTLPPGDGAEPERVRHP